MEEWITIRELERKGVSVSEIGRQLGRDRKTVRQVLTEPKPKLARVVSNPRQSKLAPYQEYLLRRIDEGCLNGVVLLEEIRGQGYSGRISILRQFLTPIRQELVRKREATERFETGPGKQAQVDWAEFGRIWVPQEERWRKLYMFLFTLGYSRAQYLEFTTCCDMEHFQHCHLGAFAALGIPEQILYDNLKTGIVGRRPDGTPILPGRFADFALYYGFTPKYCQPYRARTKGKTERGVGYVRQNFWVRVGAAVRAKELLLAELNERARKWMGEVANVRVHGTHGEVVMVRYAAEEPLLAKFDARPRFDTSYRALRRVARDGRLSYRGRLYQVALAQALRAVEVVESLDGQVTIRSQAGEVLRWALVEAGKVAPREIVQPGTTSPGPKANSGVRRLLAGEEPVVQVRDLAVYEEVARAAASR